MPHRHANFHGNIRRHGEAVRLSANAISSEVFPCHMFSLALSHVAIPVPSIYAAHFNQSAIVAQARNFDSYLTG
jgi:hypothetical protein